MTHRTQGPRGPRRPTLFTDTLTYLSVGVVVVYVLVNAGYVLFLTTLPPGSPTSPEFGVLAFFDANVAAIRLSVARLTEEGNADGAALVARLFAFAWATGIAGITAQVALVIWLALRAGATDQGTHQAYGHNFEDQLPESVWLISRLPLVLGPILLIDAYLSPLGAGIFSFFRADTLYDVQKQIDFTLVLITFTITLLLTIRNIAVSRGGQGA